MRRLLPILTLAALASGCPLDGPAAPPTPLPFPAGDGGPLPAPDAGLPDAGRPCTPAGQATACALPGDGGYQGCNVDRCAPCVGHAGFDTNCNWGDACTQGVCARLDLAFCPAAAAAPPFVPLDGPPLITRVFAEALPTSDPADCPDGGPRLLVTVDFQVPGLALYSDGGSPAPERLRLLLPGGAPGQFDYVREVSIQGTADRALAAGLCGRDSLNGAAVYLLDEVDQASNPACLPKL